MSKINQIENKLRELEAGEFHKLCDAYLHKKGYDRINPLGVLIGSNKTRKGTPDTFIPLPNGKYVFSEYTTQEKGTSQKLLGDLDKCFNETKTGIPVENIQKVIFCHTSVLSLNEEESLAKECKKFNVNLNIFGIGAISHDLYQKYPGLARDFLDISVDTGQIVDCDEFIAIHGRHKLATPLDTIFKFRDEEAENIINGLEQNDFVIITGRAGVGKSRLALESCRRFTETNPNYKVKCIFYKGQDIYEDLRVHLSELGDYLLFVDDANRVNRFEYVVQYLNEISDSRHFKIIATVRDYAVERLLNDVRNYENYSKIELQPLTEDEIKELVKDEYDIQNPLYLDRISEISQGNPRIAIMAAITAKENNTLQSIYDVSGLYDEYYKSIRQDLEELKDHNLLKVAGIVSFYKTVDRSNELQTKSIEKVFSISPEIFWEASKQLHEMEILDMYENEIVKISDQVLSTYFFYLAFFREKILDFHILLNNHFPSLRQKIVDAINPVLSAFNSDEIMRAMHSPVSRLWESYEKAGEQDKLLQLLHVFWFLKRTDTLQYLKKQIDTMQQELIDISSIKFESDSDIPSHSLLSILSMFRFANDNDFKIALELLYDYLVKRPSNLQKTFHLTKDTFSFTHESHYQKYFIQKAVLDSLWKRALNGENELFTKLFMEVSASFINTHYDTTEAKGDKAVVFINFDLHSTPELNAIRQSIWERVFILFQLPTYKSQMLKFLSNYKSGRHAKAANKIINADAMNVIPFIEFQLNTKSYSDCRFVQSYLDFLDRHEVKYAAELREKFKNKIFELSEVVLLDWTEKTELNLEYDKFQEYRRKRMKEYFTSYDIEDYILFFQLCKEIKYSISENNEYIFKNGVQDVLLVLAENDPRLYVDVIKHYFEIGASLALSAYLLIDKLISTCGATGVVKILDENNFPSIREWKFAFFHNLPESDIVKIDLNSLYTLYEDTSLEEMPHYMDFLLKYLKLDKDCFIKIVKIILENVKRNPRYAHPFTMLFNSNTEANKKISDIFKNNVDILKKAFNAYSEIGQYPDYDGKTFRQIMDLDQNFIYEYIDRIYKERKYPSEYNDDRDYSFLWERKDHESLMLEIVEYIYEKDKKLGVGPRSYVRVFIINKHENRKFSQSIVDKQDKLINILIERRNKDAEFMRFIFNIACNLSSERRLPFIGTFLENNQNFEDFEKLPLEPSFYTWSGSIIPMLKGKIRFFESLLPLLDSVEYLSHKQYIERRTQGINDWIEKEKKTEFLGD